MGQMGFAYTAAVVTGAISAEITALAIKMPNTTGARARLKRLQIGFATEAPADNNCLFRGYLTDNAGDGTKVDQTANIFQLDPLSRASLATVNDTFTVEPTTKGKAIFTQPLNSRGSWDSGEYPNLEGIEWGKTQTLIITMQSYLLAVKALVSARWQEF